MKESIRRFRYTCLLIILIFIGIGSFLQISAAPNQSNARPYRWPLDFDDGFSSTFLEYRTNHFHAGFDLRTYQKTGYPVYAISSGAVYKMHVFNRSTGRGLYLKHDDGNISVYYHLERFSQKLEDVLRPVQQAQNKKYIGEYDLPVPVPFEKGEIIAFSGETGAGYPHLHVEVRDRDFTALNPYPWIDVPTQDKNAPVLGGVLLRSRGDASCGGLIGETYLRFQKTVADTFAIRQPILVGGPFDMVLNTYDLSDCSRHVAPYQISAKMDDKPFYHVRFDRFIPDDNNQLGFVYDLSQSSSASYYFNLFSQKGFNLEQENQPLDRIVQSLGYGLHELRVRVEDYFQNFALGIIPLYKYQAPQLEVTGLVYNEEAKQLRFSIDKLVADPASEIRFDIYDSRNHRISTGNLPQSQIKPGAPFLIKGISHDASYIDFDFYLFNSRYYKKRYLLDESHLADMTTLSLDTRIYRDEVLIKVLDKRLATKNLHLQVLQGTNRETVEPLCSNDYIYFRFTPANNTNEILLHFSILKDGMKLVEIQERMMLIYLQEGVAQNFKYNEFEASFASRTVYEPKVLSVEEKNYVSVYPILSRQVSLSPNNFPFLDTVLYKFTKKLPNPKQVGIFKYNPWSKRWSSTTTKYDPATFTYEHRLISSGIFALLRDIFPPKIGFAPPTRFLKSVQRLTVRISDQGKGVDEASIKVWLNGLPICTSFDCDCQYDPDYSALKIHELSNLKKGKNTLKVEVADYAGNTTTKSFTFRLK